MNKKIVFINQATGYLTIDIINEFVNEFDEVALITGSIRIQDKELNSKVKVSRIIRYSRGNSFKKGLSWLIGTIQIILLMKFKFGSYHKFFFTIPPTAYLFALLLKPPFSIAVFDLFPEALKVYGISPESRLYKWWAERNKRIFPKAFRLYVLSDRMKDIILSYCNECNVAVIPNWTAFSGYTPVQKHRNSIRKKENLEDKFVIQYSGNIGATHNVETIIEVAGSLTEHHDIEFMIIGRGNRIYVIRELIEKKGLKNCRLLPFRRDEELYESLCSADLAIITLDERTADVSVPSKIYNLMAAGVPVIAITSINSAISEIVMKNQIGRVFGMDNVNGIKDFILELKQNTSLRTLLAENSLRTSGIYNDTNAARYLEFYKRN